MLIYKGKGDRDDPSKYRPINLLETAYRTLETVIWRRVREQVDPLLSNLQFGFRPGRNTMHPLLTLQTIIDSRQKMGLPTFIAALDMQKAFDSADHRLLVTRLALKGADRPTCRLFGALMERHYSLIEQEGAAPARVAIERGVLQGGITSPGLFLVFADSLAEEIAEAPLTDPITVGGHTVPGVLFADDTTLCAANQEDLNILLEVAGNWAAASGVKFNTSKSAILEISESARWGRRGRQPNLDMVRAPQRARQASSSDSPNNGRRHARQALDEQRDEEVVAREAARRAAVAAAAAAAEEAVATAALAAARDAAGGQDGNVEEEVEEQRRERAAAASAAAASAAAAAAAAEATATAAAAALAASEREGAAGQQAAARGGGDGNNEDDRLLVGDGEYVLDGHRVQLEGQTVVLGLEINRYGDFRRKSEETLTKLMNGYRYVLKGVRPFTTSAAVRLIDAVMMPTALYGAPISDKLT